MIPNCPYCEVTEAKPSQPRTVIRFGSFYRKSDSRHVPRFRCQKCNRSFSHATRHPCYRQKKRQKNWPLLKLLCSNNSIRRSAKLLCISRTTVARKLVFLGARAEIKLQEMNEARSPVEIAEFDDLLTIEHTKCKPLAVTLLVQPKTRKILGFEIATIAATGRLAKTAFKKYGPRKDERNETRARLFARLSPFVQKHGCIRSDECPFYPADVRTYFPHCRHETYKGKEATDNGFGEMKKGDFDQLFSINHTFAMLRANVNRLNRKTWCTTKRADRLHAHLMIYAVFHNDKLTEKWKSTG